MEITASTAAFINVLTVIDTDAFKAAGRSLDQKKPLEVNGAIQFMICTGSRGIISGQGGQSLNFKAFVNDLVMFRATSIYDNSDDAVIIYGLEHKSGSEVFNNFVTNKIELRGAAEPNNKLTDGTGLPANFVPMNFLSLDSKVQKAGTESFLLKFALYTLDPATGTQSLYGYYKWDPTITVS